MTNPSRVTNRIRNLDEHIAVLQSYAAAADRNNRRATQQAINHARRVVVILETVRNMQSSPF